MTLILILKYIMLAMGILLGNIYKPIVMVIMRSIFTIKIKDIKSESKKYELIYHLDQKYYY